MEPWHLQEAERRIRQEHLRSSVVGDEAPTSMSMDVWSAWLPPANPKVTYWVVGTISALSLTGSILAVFGSSSGIVIASWGFLLWLIWIAVAAVSAIAGWFSKDFRVALGALYGVGLGYYRHLRL